MESRKIRRKGYLIDRKLQLELGLMVSTVALALASAAFATYAKYSFGLVEEVARSPRPFEAGLDAQERARTAAVLGLSSIGVLSLACIGFSVKRSHRVAGPLRRVEGHIDQLLQGNFSVRTRLRTNDELQSIVEKLNRLSEHLQKRASYGDRDQVPGAARIPPGSK